MNEPRRLGDSLHEVLKGLRPDDRSRSSAPQPSARVMGGVFGRWEDAVGPQVAAHVQPVKLDGELLVVEVDDPAWATQLKFLETNMKTRLREVAGATIERIEVRVRRR